MIRCDAMGQADMMGTYLGGGIIFQPLRKVGEMGGGGNVVIA